MGYNISDVGGQATDGVDVWNATLDLNDPTATTVSGDFDVVSILGGGSQGEATDGYVFSALSDPTMGTLTSSAVDGTYTFTVDPGAVHDSGTDQVISFTITGTSGGSTDTDTVVITILICVARGTRIATRTGAVPVEDLLPGDLIETLDGGFQPVRWIGSRRIGAPEMRADGRLRPVRIRAGALGGGRPLRDLVVSPQHRVYLEDWRAELLFGENQVLVPAKSLINDLNIRRDHSPGGVEYFHLLFNEHQIIFTEGAPTESFHPGAYTLSGMDSDARHELIRLFPELAGGQGYGELARQGLKPWEARLLPMSAHGSQR
jgi:Hint domain-containing protein